MRLNFSSRKLYGRDQEVAELQRVYQDVKTDRRSRFVLLDGYSGNGKTALVSHLGKRIQENDVEKAEDATTTTSTTSPPKKTRIITGKFDEQHPKPYAAFAQAFGELVFQLMYNREEESECIEAVREALGTESQVLMEILPDLARLLGDENSSCVTHDGCASSNFMSPNCKSSNFISVSRRGSSAFAPKRDSSAFTSKRHITTTDETPTKRASSNHMLERMNQFRFQFKSFVRAACSTQPILMFLDDLQWADTASLELLKALFMDEGSENLMIIGAFRGQEIDENHPLSWCMMHLKASKCLEGKLSEMSLSNFDLSDLNQFIAGTLELAVEKTVSLSKVIMRKTHGNIFYSIQFLKHLVVEKLINYDMTYFQWTWDEEEVSGATDLSENVIDMVSARISQLPEDAIHILKIAACLWYSFEVHVLEFIVVNVQQGRRNRYPQRKLSWSSDKSIKGIQVGTKEQADIMKGLMLAVEEGLLDKVGSNEFKFSHDKIREATYSLIQEGKERDNLHVVLGEILWFMYNSQGSQQWMLFSAVDLLNKASRHFTTSPALQLELADVNFEAAQQAMAVSAFLPAIEYSKVGIHLLGDKPWRDQYELSLALHTELASLHSSVGNFKESEDLVNETLINAVSFDDKVSVYTTLIRSLGVQGKHTEALELAYQVLGGLGEIFPRNKCSSFFKLRVRADTMATRVLLRKYTDADILELPSLTKRRKQQALAILNQMTDSAFNLGAIFQLYLIVNRMVRISLQDGLGDVSGIVFALYGMSLNSSNGDRRESFRFGQLALVLQEQIGGKQWLCRVLVYAYVLLNHWKAPLQKSLDPLLTAYSAGMETGDVDYAFKSAGSFFTLQWYIGKGVKSGVAEMRKFCSKMREYKQDKTLSTYLPIFQCMLNMTGTSKDPTLLIGEAISKDEYDKKKMTDKTMMTYQMQLAYYFDNLWLADQLSVQLQEKVTSFEATYTYVATRFFFGMVSLRVALNAHGLRRQKNVALARTVIKEFKQWTKHGGLNCLSKLLILKAEWKAVKCSSCRGCTKLLSTKETVDTVRNAFDKAIAAAMRSGFSNDAALACERASTFCGRFLDIDWALTYLTRATTYYGQWGASAKVEHLQRNHSRMFTKEPSGLRTSGTVFGRRRFPNSSLTYHCKVCVNHSRCSVSTAPTTSRFEDGALMDNATAVLGTPPSSAGCLQPEDVYQYMDHHDEDISEPIMVWSRVG